jgi:7,8-dihydro-6-hydroxymethylpterin-pyrophosphokinase
LGRKRVPSIRNLPRTIDIDILFYDDRVWDILRLKVWLASAKLCWQLNCQKNSEQG